MDFGYLFSNSFNYAKDGLVNNPVKWIILVILSLLPMIPIIGFYIVCIFLIIGSGAVYGANPLYGSGYGSGYGSSYGSNPLNLIMGMLVIFVALLVVTMILAVLFGTFYQGFLVRALRGDQVLPEISDFPALFMDGLKFSIIQFIYFLPSIIVMVAAVVVAWLVALGGGTSINSGAWAAVLIIFCIGAGIALLLAVIMVLFWLIGIVRFARTGSVGQAFKFGDIASTIGKIGWSSYIIALVILFIAFVMYIGVFTIVNMVFSWIPYIGILVSLALWLVQVILGPFIAVFMYRYVSLIYDSAGS
jgi:hypothetical protein